MCYSRKKKSMRSKTPARYHTFLLLPKWRVTLSKPANQSFKAHRYNIHYHPTVHKLLPLHCFVMETPTPAEFSVINMAESEIKCLPPNYVKDEDERPKVPHNVFCPDIPVISLLNSSHGPQRDRIKAQLKKACEEWGIFQVVDHQVQKDLTNRIMNDAMDFFSLPVEEKLQYAIKPGNDYCGYGNGSFIKDDPLMDWRELYVTRCLPRDITLWPSKPASIRKCIEDYSDAMLELVTELLELISEALGLQSKAIENACGDAEQKLLMNYYRKCPRPDLTLGLKRHTDPGTITLLLQDKVGGLQVTRDDGRTWVTVEPIDGAFVVNLGDQMHVLSNGVFKSADHQAAVNSSTTRLSIVTFHNPNPNSMVYPLEGVVEQQNPTKFERYVYKEFYGRKMRKHIVERAKRLELMKEKEINGAV